NEYSLEFIKRDIVPDMAPVPERILLKEIEEPVRPVTSMAAYRGGTVEEQEAEEVSLPQPAVVVARGVQEELEQDVVVAEESAPVLAVTRGRIFWRLTAPSRQVAVVSALGNQPRPSPGLRPGRHSAGRPTRRSRGGWWRRRTSAGAQTDAARRPETSKVDENIGQVQGSSLA